MRGPRRTTCQVTAPGRTNAASRRFVLGRLTWPEKGCQSLGSGIARDCGSAWRRPALQRAPSHARQRARARRARCTRCEPRARNAAPQRGASSRASRRRTATGPSRATKTVADAGLRTPRAKTGRGFRVCQAARSSFNRGEAPHVALGRATVSDTLLSQSGSRLMARARAQESGHRLSTGSGSNATTTREDFWSINGAT